MAEWDAAGGGDEAVGAASDVDVLPAGSESVAGPEDDPAGIPSGQSAEDAAVVGGGGGGGTSEVQPSDARPVPDGFERSASGRLRKRLPPGSRKPIRCVPAPGWPPASPPSELSAASSIAPCSVQGGSQKAGRIWPWRVLRDLPPERCSAAPRR